MMRKIGIVLNREGVANSADKYTLDKTEGVEGSSTLEGLLLLFDHVKSDRSGRLADSLNMLNHFICLRSQSANKTNHEGFN